MFRTEFGGRRFSLLFSVLALAFWAGCKSESVSKPSPATATSSPVVERPPVGSASSDREVPPPKPEPGGSEPERKGDAVTEPPSPSQPVSNAAAGELPKVRLVGISERVVREIDDAYSAANSAPTDPKKVGELGMLYYCIQEPMAASECFAHAARLEPASVAWPYYQGLAHQALYDDEKAIAAYEAALSIDPNFQPVIVVLAGLVRDKDPTRSAALYRRAIELNPRDARAYVGLGQRAQAANKSAEAIQCYRQALEIAPDYAQAHAALAELLDSAGRSSEAERHRQEAKIGRAPPLVGDPLLVQLLSRSRNSDYLIGLAHRLVFADDFDGALNLLKRAAEESPKNRNAQEQIGIVLAMAGRLQEAADHFKGILAADRSNTVVQTHLAKALTDMGKFDEALKQYQDVLAFRPDDPQTLEQIGWLLLVLGQPAEAKGHLEKLAGFRSSDAASHLLFVASLVCVGQYEEAIPGYRFAKSLMPDEEEVCPEFVLRLLSLMAVQQRAGSNGAETSRLTMENLARLGDQFLIAKMDREAKSMKDPISAIVDSALNWAGRGEYRKATSALEAVMPLDRGGKLAGAMGSVCVMQRRYAVAEDWFRAAMKADPTSAANQSNLGGVLAHLGKAQEAESMLREVLSKQPENSSAMQQLGILMGRQGKTDEALALWRRATALQPNDAKIHISLGNLLGRLGQFREAMDHLKKALEIEPENAAVLYQIGVSCAASQDAQGALTYWRRAVEIQPGHVEATAALAGASMMKGDYAAAEKLLRDGLRYSPGSATLANGLAWILATCEEAGRRDGQGAVRWAKSACELTKFAHHKFMDTLAASYAEAGQFEKAVETSGQAVKLAEKAGDRSAAKTYSDRLELFKAHKPYRDQKKSLDARSAP